MKRFKKFLLCAGLTATGFVILFAPKRANAEAGDVALYEVIDAKMMPQKGQLDALKQKRNELISRQATIRNEEVKIESGGGDGEETQTLPAGTESVIIKQGNGTVVVWAETPIADIDQYKSDYLSTPGRDPSIKTDDNFVPIDGYGTHELNPVLGNPWKTYTFGVNPDTGASYFTANGGAYSHINAEYKPPVITPGPTNPVVTPGPTDPSVTPGPTDPNVTPGPTDPSVTPSPTPVNTQPNYYPQTGDNSFNSSAGYGALTILGVGIVTGGTVLAKRMKKAKRGY